MTQIAPARVTTSPVVTRSIRTVLVANRGEIACRIIRTLRELGIRSVAVYSDPDREAKHVAEADLALRIGPAPARESYLDVSAVIAAAERAGADAIHPGYGFLAENTGLAAECERRGIVFIGPSAFAIETMGDKIRAKQHVAAKGVPVIPGIDEPGLDDEALVDAAGRIGFPLLIKPSAGGGGKGMQVVREHGELAQAIAAARRVAASSFGDDTLFLERLIERPRHIEVQVLADASGTVIHLGERECSLQRRHQKVIEEAPSPLLDDETRQRIGEAACEVARSVGYRGAGTVEFLVSANRPDEFFFMEMNTRLQVEHPVTEEVTGVDLVAWQLRIAAGEPLTLRQADVTTSGHAIEARLYAEDPAAGFLPSTGTVTGLREASGVGIRVDSSLIDGLVIGSDYDPMLSKVIAWGADRDEAIARLRRALADTVVLGLRTNAEYLGALLDDPAVVAGDLDTTLIERRLPGLVFPPAGEAFFVAAALACHGRLAATGSPWNAGDGWRLSGPRGREYLVAAGTETTAVRVLGPEDDARVAIGGAQPSAAALIRSHPGDGRARLSWNGATVTVDLAVAGGELWVSIDGRSRPLRTLSREAVLAERLAAREATTGRATPEVRTPMPGTVVAVLAANGERVEEGQAVLVVEAMKMEHRLLAPVTGTLSLCTDKGALVKLDQLLATITTPSNIPEPDTTGPGGHDPTPHDGDGSRREGETP